MLSVSAQGGLTARLTGRAGTKVGTSDPAIPCGWVVAQRIKGTPGNHMENYVKNLGFKKNVNQFYRFIDCLVVPSKIKEAFGLVICESMYCNTPVITSTSGAQEEIITHGENGLLLDTVADITIANAIEYFMDNPAEYEEIRKKGYHRIESTFTIEKMVSSIKSL